MRALSTLNYEQFSELLQRDNVLVHEVATLLASHISELAREQPLTASQLNERFASDPAAFTLRYSTLDTFYGGLESKIGAPKPHVAAAMEHEHTGRADSDEHFQTSNYLITTSPRVEWEFVACPEDFPTRDWPRETRVHCAKEAPSYHPRSPLLREERERRLAAVNGRLEAMREPTLMPIEMSGGRMYTGPMYFKYNTVLRGQPPEVLSVCHGNTYTTSLHVINSCIVKTSKLTQCTKVFRGVRDGVLPPEFWEANEFGVRGGIEQGFMSTTQDRQVALEYARTGGRTGCGIVFEIQQGMIDRGADLQWLSQYPHELEILFAPLTGLEVNGTRVEGSVLVVMTRLTVNLQAPTIEQVISKRRRAVADTCSNLAAELHQEMATSPEWAELSEHTAAAEAVLSEMLSRLSTHEAERYNDDDVFADTMQAAVQAKAKVNEWPRLIDRLRPFVSREALPLFLRQTELMHMVFGRLHDRTLRLQSAYFPGQHLYVTYFVEQPRNVHSVLTWKMVQDHETLSQAKLRVELVPDHPDQVRLVSAHFHGTPRYIYAADEFFEGDEPSRRRYVFASNGPPTAHVLSRARFRVELVDGQADQIRLASIHFPGEYLYVAAIDYGSERLYIFTSPFEARSPRAYRKSALIVCEDALGSMFDGPYGRVLRFRSVSTGGYLHVPDHDAPIDEIKRIASSTNGVAGPSRELVVRSGPLTDAELPTAEFRLEMVEGGVNEVSVRSVHWASDLVYVPELSLEPTTREVFVWKGANGDEILRLGRFLVEKVDGHHARVRLRSVHFTNQLLVVSDKPSSCGGGLLVKLWSCEPDQDSLRRSLWDYEIVPSPTRRSKPIARLISCVPRPSDPSELIVFGEREWALWDHLAGVTKLRKPRVSGWFKRLPAPFDTDAFAVVEDPRRKKVVLFFHRTQVLSWDFTPDEPIDVRPISDVLGALPGAFASGALDAVVQHPGLPAQLILFCGRQWLTFDCAAGATAAGPCQLGDDGLFAGIQDEFRDGVHAAVGRPGFESSQLVLFRGAYYVVYDVFEQRQVHPPCTISGAGSMFEALEVE